MWKQQKTENSEMICLCAAAGREEVLAKVQERAGLLEMEEEVRNIHLENIDRLFEQFFQDLEIFLLLVPFSTDCIGSDGFYFPSGFVPCNGLTRLTRELSAMGRNGVITHAYLYGFQVALPDVAYDTLLEQYYLEHLQIALLDYGRDWLQSELQKRYADTGQYVTDSFGTGFFGIPVEGAEIFLREMCAERIGLCYQNGVVLPLKSSHGIYLVTSLPIAATIRDCAGCQGSQTGCRLCRHGQAHKK